MTKIFCLAATIAHYSLVLKDVETISSQICSKEYEPHTTNTTKIPVVANEIVASAVLLL